MEYIYHGDRMAKALNSPLIGKHCKAIRFNGNCIRGTNSNMLVEFEKGNKQVILARMLRKVKQ